MLGYQSDWNYQLKTSEYLGLDPRAWLCVGSGFSREEVKEAVLSECGAISKFSVTSLEEIAREGLQIPKTQMIGALTRQEILGALISKPALLQHFDRLVRLKRQRGFLEKLDRAIFEGRLSYVFDEDIEAYEQKLISTFGSSDLRSEIRILSRAYEQILHNLNLLDYPMLLRKFCEEQSFPELPREIHFLSASEPQVLEQFALDQLGEGSAIKFLNFQSVRSQNSVDVLLWNSLDDASEAIFDEISKAKDSGLEWKDLALVFSGTSEIRRALRRVCTERNIPLSEDRDPTQLRWDEYFKRTFLDLDVVISNFDRVEVGAWILHLDTSDDQKLEWIEEINKRGVRVGIQAYQGGKLDSVFERLVALKEFFGTRLSVGEIATRHTHWIKELQLLNARGAYFVRDAWKIFFEDLEKIEPDIERKRPLYFWVDRFRQRLFSGSSLVSNTKASEGLNVYRVGQAPIRKFKKIWFFGLSSSWFRADDVGDYWFSSRERIRLGAEFSVRNPIDVSKERIKVFETWLGSADQMSLYDYGYSPLGKEREEFSAELEQWVPQITWESKACGAHPRWERSYVNHPVRKEAQVQLNAIVSHSLHASWMDRMSRCSFIALVTDRWKLKDMREPGLEMWPEIKGRMLHGVVEKLLLEREKYLSLDEQSSEFKEEVLSLLRNIWGVFHKKGLVESEVLKESIQHSLFRTLQVFWKKEKEYVERSNADVMSIEGSNLPHEILSYRYRDLEIRGVPDRIDQHEDGLFVLDYKTTSAVPHGRDILDLKYRMQLPFYAVALRKEMKQSVLGVGFIQLDKKGSRSSGIFSDSLNGKKKGALTNTRSKNSVFSRPMDEIWDECEDSIQAYVDQYLEGKYAAKPKKIEECRLCRFQDLCGLRRRIN